MRSDGLTPHAPAHLSGASRRDTCHLSRRRRRHLPPARSAHLLPILFLLFAAALRAEPSVLEMIVKPDELKPDILFLAPRLTAAPKAYRKALEPAARLGTVLPNATLTAEDFRAAGPLPILGAADYHLLPIRDIPWRAACERLDDILTLRRRRRRHLPPARSAHLLPATCHLLPTLFLLFAAVLRAEPSVLEMIVKPDELKPDILFLAPRLTAAPKAYRKALEPAARLGTVLPNATLTAEDFRAAGPLPILGAADYHLLPIRDIPWRAACERLDDILTLRRATRAEDGIVQAPLCALLCEDASPEDLAATLPALLRSDALILLAPQTNALPLTVSWRNRVWPAHRSTLPVRADHWVPTFADIVGLPAPADCADASILPLLTGIGYQRPLDLPPATPQPVATTLPCTELRLYDTLPKGCPWVPDFTLLLPSDRLFLRALPPLPPTALKRLGRSRQPRGLYLRAALKILDLRLPPGVSCVVREKGRPVFSVWQPETPSQWQLDRPAPVPVELFLLLPPNLDPATLSLFRRP